MADAPCLVELRALKAVIDARVRGEQVSSAGHKGRSITHSEVSLDSQIAYYRQLWRACPDAAAELPDLQPLDSLGGTRGRAARFTGRSVV